MNHDFECPGPSEHDGAPLPDALPDLSRAADAASWVVPEVVGDTDSSRVRAWGDEVAAEMAADPPEADDAQQTEKSVENTVVHNESGVSPVNEGQAGGDAQPPPKPPRDTPTPPSPDEDPENINNRGEPAGEHLLPPEPQIVGCLEHVTQYLTQARVAAEVADDWYSPDEHSVEQRVEQLAAVLAYVGPLREAGLKFSDDLFFEPSLKIVDGGRFLAALTTIQQASETLRSGLEDIVNDSLQAISEGYIPDLLDDNYYTFHTNPKLKPTLQPELAADSINAWVYNRTVSQVLLHAQKIASQLQDLGVNPEGVARLRNAHTAELEGMLPYWAVANHWGLDMPPTTNDHDLEWTQWSVPDEWQKFHEFLDSAAAKARPNSKFLHNIVTGMLTNIDNVRNDILVPSKRLPPRSAEGPDENTDAVPFYYEIEETPEEIALHAALNVLYQREHDALLDAAEEKLKQFLRE